MIDRITVGAAAVMSSLVGVTAIARAWPKPSGRRRAPHPLLRPVEALDRFEDRCPVERRDTLHVRFRSGAVMCMDCRHPADEGGGGS